MRELVPQRRCRIEFGGFPPPSVRVCAAPGSCAASRRRQPIWHRAALAASLRFPRSTRKNARRSAACGQRRRRRGRRLPARRCSRSWCTGRIWNGPIACGLVLGMWVHELGHRAVLPQARTREHADRVRSLIGATQSLRTRPLRAHDDARMALMGPLYGLLFASACKLGYLATARRRAALPRDGACRASRDRPAPARRAGRRSRRRLAAASRTHGLRLDHGWPRDRDALAAARRDQPGAMLDSDTPRARARTAVDHRLVLGRARLRAVPAALISVFPVDAVHERSKVEAQMPFWPRWPSSKNPPCRSRSSASGSCFC